ncbi:hypothetical protein D9756_000637 [Leucocoprinus leucothites]|uniref:Uncharacterized protein n=1 Tax=Leucocoprinus leucothites TaxID=201217 RepID=A0A8H5GGB3_9AGAR|nr:hypothetical protein D9756_000637 [Leucoagaricus leucothites]
MSDSLKRTLTDDNQASSMQSESFNRTYTSPELIAQLRSVGPRVRKSVTEGYSTPPTSRAFTKAQSTTTIFSSAKDINRDVFGSSSNLSTGPDPANPHKKRSRSADRGSDTELDQDIDHDMQLSDNAVPDSQLSQNRTGRVIKPLRKHRGMMETRSLPVEAFRFSHQPVNSVTTMAPAAEEAEDDWSQTVNTSNQSTFTPVVFD